MHVMQLDKGNSQALLAHEPHNQLYIVATSSHSDCKANEILYSCRLATTKSHTIRERDVAMKVLCLELCNCVCPQKQRVIAAHCTIQGRRKQCKCGQANFQKGSPGEHPEKKIKNASFSCNLVILEE